MNRRLVAAAVAVLLAGVGAVLVLSYVSGADQRAMAGMEPVSVLTVAGPIPAGTPAEELAELVAVEELPTAAVASGAASSLTELGGKVATVDLQPGEQLLASRFTDPEAFEAAAEVDVPTGMQEVSVLLDPQRVLGGHLTAGDTVGVFISVTEPSRTKLVLHKVLVTRVEGAITQAPAEAAEAAADPEATTAAPVSESSVMVTLAAGTPAAESIVFAAEHGTIWLSLEGSDASEDGSRVVTKENVYE